MIATGGGGWRRGGGAETIRKYLDFTVNLSQATVKQIDSKVI